MNYMTVGGYNNIGDHRNGCGDVDTRLTATTGNDWETNFFFSAAAAIAAAVAADKRRWIVPKWTQWLEKKTTVSSSYWKKSKKNYTILGQLFQRLLKRMKKWREQNAEAEKISVIINQTE